MAASRKDSRGYALRTGECQRTDGLDLQKAERITLNRVYDAYMAQKYNLKETIIEFLFLWRVVK